MIPIVNMGMLYLTKELKITSSSPLSIDKMAIASKDRNDPTINQMPPIFGLKKDNMTAGKVVSGPSNANTQTKIASSFV
ncbi:MAG: hypothetical protein ACE5GK_09885, partial [Nitrospiria bacterium]